MSRNPFMIATPPTANKSCTMKTDTNGASGDGASLFRPSALSSKANEMWKTSTTKTNEGENDKPLIPSLFDKSAASDAGSKKTDVAKPQASAFVFGSQIKDRVETTAPVSETGAAGFSALAKKTENGEKTDESAAKPADDVDASTSKQERMMASAAQLDKARNVTTESSAVDQKTGEEDDSQLCRSSCKLHQFDSGEWVERGVGTLALNQMQHSDEVRLVMRRKATHQLMLNSKLYAGMTLERLSAKRIKFSAIDPETKAVAVYLMTAPESSTEEFLRLMESRLKRLDAAPKPRKRAADETEEVSKKKKDDEEDKEVAKAVNEVSVDDTAKEEKSED